MLWVRVEGGDRGLARGHDLLDLAQTLLGLRHEGGLGELLEHEAVLFFGVSGLGVVAVGLVHLAEVDVADAHLGLGGLGSVGEEGDEVLVLLLGLGEGCGAAFLVPAVGDGELGLHLILRVGIGVEQGLEVETGDVEVAALGGVEGLVVEHLVGQAGIDGLDLLLFRSSFLVSLDWTTLSPSSCGVAERVTVCCGLPLASVVVCEEPVTCAMAPMERAKRLAIAMPANALALTVGKKERLFIRYRPHPPRARMGAQAAFYSNRSRPICAGAAARASLRNSRAFCSVLPGAKMAEPATSMSAPASTTRATVS